MQSYSQNIIFLDTEFTTLDPAKGELMSIGLVRLDDGKELYLELEYNPATAEPWVKKHVVPNLTGKKVTRAAACKKIEQFIGKPATKKDKKPYLMAYVNQFDAIYWYKLFGSAKEHPAYWIPLDFASVLFAHGYSPNSLGKHRFFKELGLNKDDGDTHNALDDARRLREIYVRFLERVKSATS